MKTEDNYKVRSAAVTNSGRTSFRFDTSTWTAIDMVAEKAGMTWIDWVTRAIASRPHAKSKASAVRAALADALLLEQFNAMAEDKSVGSEILADEHPIVGTGYYRLDDQSLSIELENARITLRDDSFEGFTLIVGYRDITYGGNAFLCVENRLRDGLHLFIVTKTI